MAATNTLLGLLSPMLLPSKLQDSPYQDVCLGRKPYHQIQCFPLVKEKMNPMSIGSHSSNAHGVDRISISNCSLSSRALDPMVKISNVKAM